MNKKYLCKFQFDKSWFTPGKVFQKEIEYDQDIKALKNDIAWSIKVNKDPYKLLSIKEIN